jgi:hypothetical protein
MYYYSEDHNREASVASLDEEEIGVPSYCMFLVNVIKQCSPCNFLLMKRDLLTAATKIPWF